MNKKDLENLELILEKICENNESVFYKIFQDEKGNPFGIKNDEEAERYFIRLTFKFESIGIAYYNNSSFVLSPVNNECIKFKDKGGFKTYFEKEKEQSYLESESILKQQEKEQRDEKIQLYLIEEFEYKETIRKQSEKIAELTTDNLRLQNWDIRFRWYIAIVTFILGIIIKNIIGN
jgi:hypothetical protein